MPEYALTKDGVSVAEFRLFKRRPPDPRGKGWIWLRVTREEIAHDATPEAVIDIAGHGVNVRTPAPPPPGYRAQRRDAYVSELGEEVDFNETVGDVLDDVIREMAALGAAGGGIKTPEFQTLVDKVTAIKTRYPKPVQP